jgi:phosphotransferase system HPr (HPr) family protein
MIWERITIRNPHGLHARPAAEFVKAATKFKSSVELARDDRQWVNGKSVLGILTLAVEQEQTLILKIDGKGNAEEEQQALAVLRKILEGETEPAK